jgi:DNA-binding SARP family transcriptional activator/basic membrane lipoprotein Med (substrate-binding protein (PBP1-ABC) superfamily)
VLLLHAGEVVSVERLIDEVWGDQAPPSAAHSLEAYVSRIRQTLNGYGPRVVRRGGGYVLELGGAALDARAFGDELDAACAAADEADFVRASEHATRALALWRGAALADVSLASAGRAEAERLEELRLRAHEQRFGAELERGRHAEVVGELQVLVQLSPYRERFVAQLMLALYRSGRHAEALDVYEQTRRRLDDDLGLQPSSDLRQLSGQIVRQDSGLRSPARVAHQPLPQWAPRSRRLATLVAGGVAAAAVMSLTASGSTPLVGEGETSPAKNRVALVVSKVSRGAGVDLRAREATRHVRQVSGSWDHETETVSVSGVHPGPAVVERAVERVEQGDFDFVVVVGEPAVMRAFADLARRQSSTQFVFLDESLASLSLKGVPNATGIRFAVEESSFVVGYLSGLVAPRGKPSTTRADVVSVVAATRTPQTRHAIEGYRLGVRRASARTAVRVSYAGDVLDKTACERLANAQIDAGSDVIYAVAGYPCSSAVVAVARLRGVWAILSDPEAVPPNRHVLLTTDKWWERAVSDALDGLELDLLPAGDDVVLGLADDYAVGFERISSEIPERSWSKVVAICSKVRRGALDVP